MADENLFSNMRNIRDLGGMKTADGRSILVGRLIRSNSLSELSEPFRTNLLRHVDTVVDLRSPMEIRERPQYLTEGVNTVSLPLIEENVPGISRLRFSDKIVIYSYLFRPEAAKNYMKRMYEMLIEREFSRRQMEKFVRLLLEPHEKAVLWHCSAGKDRAGIAAMITEALLGVSKEMIIEDYLRSAENLKPDIENKKNQVREKFPYAKNAPRAIEYLFGAEKEYILSAYEKIERGYGSFENFVSVGLHLGAEEIEALRERYLTRI